MTETNLEKKVNKPNYDIKACFLPFNEAINALYPFFKLLKSKLRPGDVILALEDRTGWMATLLSGIFPGCRVVSTCEENDGPSWKDIPGYKEFNLWFQNEKNISVSFCDLNKPLPFADKSFSLVVGYDILHNFNPPLLISELLRVTIPEGAVVFPHVHLDNSVPEPYFERGDKQLHGLDYQSFFQKLSENGNRQGYVFSEAKLYMFNESGEEKAMNLISEPDTKDYNALIALLPNSWDSETLEVFNLRNIESVENSRILINHLLDINLHQQIVRVNGSLDFLFNRHPVYLKRIENSDGYLLDETSCKLLYWGQYCLTLAEIAIKLKCDIHEVVDICEKLESKNIIQVLPISENGLRLHNFICTQKYQVPYSEQNFRTLWLKAVDRYKDNILIYGEDGSELSYEDCNVITGNIIRSLKYSGLKKGDRVIFFCRANTEEVLTIWACLQAGITVVPVDHHTPEPILRQIFSAGNIKFSFVSNRTYNTAKQVFSTIPLIIFDEGNDLPPVNISLEKNAKYFSDWCTEETPETEDIISHSDEAVLIFIPLTAGRHTGVSLSHGNLLRTGRLSSETSHWEMSDKYFVLACMKTITGFRNCCFTPLMAGASIVIPSEEAFQNPIISIPETIFLSKSTILLINPSLLRSLIILKNRNSGPTDSIRIVTSIENIDGQLKKDFYDAFHININDYYNITEPTGFFVTQTAEKTGENQVYTGKQFDFIAQVIDEKDRIVPVEKTGKLRIYGENLMEFNNQPELAKEFFRNGWFYTGDIAKLTEDGNIIFS